ncbi:flagellar hook protein [Campylobacter subantarcticus LMG 24377]|uniref:Flagellar hook protein n=2 Tax=Campylobacter subantarcticus TaxID=497724 RepID=A0A0A8HBU6_9BACT|nr:flagellar hook-basal body complex protein [Campylobacter subantarcticus]EAJ1261508.1 flagellar hook protein FlgE [Campylobacter lari]AJC91526.1 flagellar hook protein [Campylobacter subantarcticus LMG 24374]AJC93298.1 flagellar hook protein [Campylobacter subantarcticus LMG 24377]EAL3939554.1 flagellar hook protein FlgE [Campylobacter lari]MPB98510.1 flagellar hook protein FlgE [Campylobacter subantarcticus]
MFTAFYNGVNGVKAQSYSIDNTAHNISNVNTVGFKYSEVGFKDVFYNTITTQSYNNGQSGYGSVAGATNDIFEQGPIVSTDNEFDVAITGKGFFGVSNGNGVYYTRNGAFKPDANGNLVDSNGNYVLGTMNPSLKEIQLSERVSGMFGQTLGQKVTTAWTGTPEQNFQMGGVNTQGPISVPKNLYLPPQPTQNITWHGNLDTSTKTEAVNISVDTSKFEFSKNEDGSVNILGNIKDEKIYGLKPNDTIYFKITDEKGASQTLQATLDENLSFNINNQKLDKIDLETAKLESSHLSIEKEVADSTELSAKLINPDGSVSWVKITLDRVLPQNGTDLEYKAQAQIYDNNGNKIGGTSNGLITFNESGALVSNTLTSIDNNGIKVNIDLGSYYDPNIPNSGYDGLHALKNKQPSVHTQIDGKGEGFLNNYSINTDGTVVATFTNGDQVAIAKLALYNFTNEQGLEKLGENLYGQTGNSGNPTFLTDANGNFSTATFEGGKLEQSNVDLSVAFANLITLQKAYDSSSKSITTADQMIQKAINMKR